MDLPLAAIRRVWEVSTVMPKLKPPRKVILPILAVLLTIIFGCAVWMVVWVYRYQHMPIMEKVAVHMQREGVMSFQDFMQLNTLGYSIHETGRISDTNLDWMLALLKDPAPVPSEYSSSMRVANIAGDLREVRHFTPTQDREVLQAFLPLTYSKNNGVVEEALGLLATLDNSEAVPYIRPLLNASNPMVRYNAWRALHHLGALPSGE